MAISGPQSVISSIKNRLRIFRHTQEQQMISSGQEGSFPPSRPLEEIPGTKASFEATAKQAESQSGQGEKKG